MLTSIFDMNVNDYEIKDGDIKVNACEMRELLNIVQAYHNMLCVNLEQLDKDEQEELNNGLQFTEYFQNKYIVLGEARKKQKRWFDMLKKFDDKEFTKNSASEEIEECRRMVWGNYLEAKGERERIQRELDRRANEINQN